MQSGDADVITQAEAKALGFWHDEIPEDNPTLGPDGLVLGVPNGFVLEYVAHHYRAIIEKTLEGLLGHPMTVSFTVLSRAPHLEVFQAEGRGGQERTGQPR